MPPKFSAMKMPKGAYIDNEAHHNFTDMNGGGGPHGMRNKPSMSMRSRSGAGTNANGRDPAPSTSMNGRGSSGMPSAPYRSEGRDSSMPDMRVPSHGGSPQHRGGAGSGTGFGDFGKSNVPNDYSHANPQPSSGNVSGRSHRLIAGRFKRAAMGARSSGSESKGSYGAAPVTANT
jgi:hypothetical protein